ncbi:hypothetical protein [Actinomadura rubteroloni]|nr:hypothetical protein [Actinomadura rubteroloni]
MLSFVFFRLAQPSATMVIRSPAMCMASIPEGGNVQVSGRRGSVILDGEWVEILHGDPNQEATRKAATRVHISKIIGVAIRPPGLFTNGFFRLILQGDADAGFDRNGLFFTRGQRGEFDVLRAEIERSLPTHRT